MRKSQNALMANHLQRVQRAVNALMKQGITVLTVELAHHKPRIQIQAPRTPNIGETLIIQGTQAGVREELQFANFSGCIVFWKK